MVAESKILKNQKVTGSTILKNHINTGSKILKNSQPSIFQLVNRRKWPKYCQNGKTP